MEEAPSQEQAEKVRALFHRQLGVPLADGADTLAAYKAWEQAQQGAGTAQFEVCAGAAWPGLRDQRCCTGTPHISWLWKFFSLLYFHPLSNG